MELKKIPQVITKQVLTDMYEYQFTKAQIRRDINEIIRENRKNETAYRELIKAGKNLSVQKLRDKEVLEYMETYGFPKGYIKSEKLNI